MLSESMLVGLCKYNGTYYVYFVRYNAKCVLSNMIFDINV